MNTLLIGGTGVLGSELSAALVAAGHAVWVLSDGYGPRPVPAGTCGHIVADRNNSASLASALGAQPRKWDLVVDSACYRKEQVDLIRAALPEFRGQVIFISTTFVYHPGSHLPLREDAPLGRRDEIGAYAAEKRQAEDAWLASGLPVTILRLPHVLAPGCMPGAVPLHNRDPQLVARLRQGWPIWLVDGGHQAMQFIAGTDAGRAVWLSAKLKEAGIFNCAHAMPTTGREYVETLARLLGVTPILRNIPSPIHSASGWGWELSTVPRVCDTHALDQRIGPAPTTLKASMHRCLAEWTAAASPIKVDPLAALVPLSSEIEMGIELRRLASTREVSAIDRRMNPDLPPRFSA